MVDAIGEQTTTIADAMRASIFRETWAAALDADSYLVCSRTNSGRSASSACSNWSRPSDALRQIAAAALLFESKRGFKRAVGAEGGHRAFQAVSMMLQSLALRLATAALIFSKVDG